MGSHPVINSIEQGEGDPLVVSSLGEMIEMIEAMGLEDEGNGIGLWLAPDDLHKANTSGGEPYTMYIPNAAADANFEYECHQTTFVNYLRIAFQWGGFPGWEHNTYAARAPREILTQLTEGLLPF